MSGLDSLPENHRIRLKEAMDLWLERDSYKKGSVSFNIARRAYSEILIKAYHAKAFEWKQGYEPEKGRRVRHVGIGGASSSQPRKMVESIGESTVFVGEFRQWLREIEQPNKIDDSVFSIESVYTVFSLLLEAVKEVCPYDDSRASRSGRISSNISDQQGGFNFQGTEARLQEVAGDLGVPETGLSDATLIKDYNTGLKKREPEGTTDRKRNNLIKTCYILTNLICTEGGDLFEIEDDNFIDDLRAKLDIRQTEHPKLNGFSLTSELVYYCISYNPDNN